MRIFFKILLCTFGWFSKLPRNNRPKVFSRLNPSGRVLVAPTKMLLNRCLSSLTHSRLHFRPPLSYFLHSFTPKSLLFPPLSSITSKIPQKSFKTQKPQFSFKTLTAHIPFGRPWHPLEPVPSEKEKLPCKKTLHLTMITQGICLGKLSTVSPLGTSILVGFQTFLI